MAAYRADMNFYLRPSQIFVSCTTRSVISASSGMGSAGRKVPWDLDHVD